MFLNGRPVVHMISLATPFFSALLVHSQETSDVWAAIHMMWCHSYMGPPDFLVVDHGSNYASEEMKWNTTATFITIIPAPVESQNTVGNLERYHAPLLSAFKKVRRELGPEVSEDYFLRIALLFVNNTVGPEGLCSTLLVFG